jgi:hypothetical protein
MRRPKLRDLEDWKVGRLGKPLNPWQIHTFCARALLHALLDASSCRFPC